MGRGANGWGVVKGIKNIEFIIGDKKIFLGNPDLLIIINEDI